MEKTINLKIGSLGETRAYVIAPETGEIVDALYYGDRIIRSTSVETLREMEGEKVSSPIKKFTKQNNEELPLLLKELSHIEAKFLFGCMCNLGYEDNCIKDIRGEPLSVAEIADRIGIPRSSAFRAADGLLQKAVLSKAESKRELYWFLCPLLAGRGTKYNKVLQTMFRRYKVRSKGGSPWGELIGGDACGRKKENPRRD